eukprot:TRINITY_DN1168_c0_g5_i2.p1 TRINITY_DN1168_c0_g5~~TRINITY_DN1168_c0_g5_i2.p1  ORF type:complete len:139 (+),score=17.69 TRINITY_DN1168_c0_g5_i2:418-834(+)
MKMSAMAVKTVSRKAVTPMNRWVKAEVFPLIAMMSAGLGFMTYTCVRSLTTAPDVFVVKQKRQEGGASITEAQGRVYKHGPVREFVRVSCQYAFVVLYAGNAGLRRFDCQEWPALRSAFLHYICPSFEVNVRVAISGT